jgi:alkanesulfonate monooxygenase SsuD/methylene tetrahydromethanopterin reductase-like flavin-dependent oxidoreductase (luciferase family)
VQQPHPPLLIGGNSKRAIRRAVELGDAWNPYFTASTLLANTSRTKEMRGEDDLADGIAYLRAQSEAAGRATPPPVILSSFNEGGETPDALLEKAARMAELGVAEVTASVHGATPREWCDNAELFAEQVLRKLG